MTFKNVLSKMLSRKKLEKNI